jgi:hypothetical protein
VTDSLKLTLFWNGAIKVGKKGNESVCVLFISGNNRVTLENLSGQSVIVNSRSCHIVGEVNIKHFLFQFRRNKDDNECI